MTICRNCNGSGCEPSERQPDPVAVIVAELRDGCERLGIARRWDGSVTEAEAAQLLHRAASTLANWRALATGPEWQAGRRVRYTLSALARWCVDDRCAG